MWVRRIPPPRRMANDRLESGGVSAEEVDAGAIGSVRVRFAPCHLGGQIVTGLAAMRLHEDGHPITFGQRSIEAQPHTGFTQIDHSHLQLLLDTKRHAAAVMNDPQPAGRGRASAAATIKAKDRCGVAFVGFHFLQHGLIHR